MDGGVDEGTETMAEDIMRRSCCTVAAGRDRKKDAEVS
jgi:hypothetical protein